jgi:hypothetical protein
MDIAAAAKETKQIPTPTRERVACLFLFPSLTRFHSSQAVMAQPLKPSSMVSLWRSIFQKEYNDRAAPAALR